MYCILIYFMVHNYIMKQKIISFFANYIVPLKTAIEITIEKPVVIQDTNEILDEL